MPMIDIIGCWPYQSNMEDYIAYFGRMRNGQMQVILPIIGEMSRTLCMADHVNSSIESTYPCQAR